MIRKFLVPLAVVVSASCLAASTPQAPQPKPPADDNRLVNPTAGTLFKEKISRPLRYHPEGIDFVIENGREFFNRPLYVANSAFRIDAGDKPEFGLYLPGRGGNLRLGILVGGKVKWLHLADRVIARYRPGSMVYEIRDSLLGTGVLRVTVLGLADAKGLIACAEIEGKDDVTLVAAFGGANGDKGARAVDIGAEAVPVSDWWRLKPEYCADNQFVIDGSRFLLKAKAGTIGGFLSSDARIVVGNAADWDNPEALLAGVPEPASPVAVALSKVTRRTPAYIMLKLLSDNTTETASREAAPDLAAVFEVAEKHRRGIAEKIVVNTPDPFINAAASAICVAADGIWEEKDGVWMHGAIAWRARYLGWRGPYSGHTLGWHDRSQRHLSYWPTRQLTKPAKSDAPMADEKWNLARSQTALLTSGMFTPTGTAAYDMNLIYIDALFRHLLWTGDVEFARQMWPVVERHFEWEQRLFRREFTGANGEKLPLYEGYCCIWASDDLSYNGGGTTHASAYNFYHNKIAAKLAKLIGKDPAPYEREAELIAKGMRQHLWLAERGWFAEYKDLIGLQRTHDYPLLATFYHTIDSEVPTAAEANRMMRYVDTYIAHIPVKGVGVPDDRNYFTMPTSNWMPYSWSINNVAMAESSHAALAYWQAGRRETAFELFKGSVLDGMFMGLCPGNVGMTTQFDMGTGERYRDFADGVGAMSRTLIEGLFGLKPDALAGELIVRPGFPEAWDHASLQHPDIKLDFQRKGMTETFSIQPKFSRPMSLQLEVAALRDSVASITVNGQPAKWRLGEDDGARQVIIKVPSSAAYEVVINWKGEKSPEQPLPTVPLIAEAKLSAIDWDKSISSNLECVNLDSIFNDSVTQIFRNEYRSPRSPFASLSTPIHGFGNWCYPKMTFEVDDSGLRTLAAKNHGRIVLPNGLAFQTSGVAEGKNIAFVSQWDNYPHEIVVPLSGKASQVYLLMAGSTNPMQSHLDNGEVIIAYTDGSSARLALHNPTTWWPIDQDYVIDDYAFRYDGPIPPRLDLQTGKVRIPKRGDLAQGPNLVIPGGAATVLNLPLDPTKQLQSLTVRAIANEVVVGLMSVTLER